MRTLSQPAASATASLPALPPVEQLAAPYHTDPTLGAALFAAWSGDPAVVVASPPGAGKTRLVVHLAEQLHRRAGLQIAIATQTRTQALDVTNRAAAIGASVALLGSRESHRPPSLDPAAGYLEGAARLSRWRGIAVATTARWLWVNEREYTADACLVDEAWSAIRARSLPSSPATPDAGETGPPAHSGLRQRRSWPPIRTL